MNEIAFGAGASLVNWHVTDFAIDLFSSFQKKSTWLWEYECSVCYAHTRVPFSCGNKALFRARAKRHQMNS